MALRTYFSNTFLLDKFFLKEFKDEDKKVSANYQHAGYLTNFTLRHDQDDLLEFSDWLKKFIHTERFLKTKTEFDEIERQLITEPVGRKRTMLVKRLLQLI